MKENNRRFYDKINESAYENFEDVSYNYDPNYSNYDPDMADAPQGNAATNIQQARPGVKLQFNLTVQNPTAVKLNFELFSGLCSWADVYRPDLVLAAAAAAGHTQIPQLSTEGLATVGIGTIGYDQNGDLRNYGAAAAASGSIGCGEYPYKCLVESTKTLPFKNILTRISVLTAPQLNNQITHFTKTFGGGFKSNVVNVRAFKKPTQFQNLEVDVTAPFVIDGEKGLVYPLEIGEVVQMSLFVNRWAKPQI